MRRRIAAERWRPPALARSLAGGLALTLGTTVASAQQPLMPMPPTGPAPAPAATAPAGTCSTCGHKNGLIHRAMRHVWHGLKDNLIGYPEEFVEPPLGATRGEINAQMVARADLHRYTLYRSDFLANSPTLTQGGARRLNDMAKRLPGWLGPLMIEATPDRPGLAEARRDAIALALAQCGQPVGPERLVVAGSPYPGLPGTYAVNSHAVLIDREVRAPMTYSVSPTESDANFVNAGSNGGP
jgi:hypothetical protein